MDFAFRSLTNGAHGIHHIAQLRSGSNGQLINIRFALIVEAKRGAFAGFEIDGYHRIRNGRECPKREWRHPAGRRSGWSVTSHASSAFCTAT